MRLRKVDVFLRNITKQNLIPNITPLLVILHGPTLVSLSIHKITFKNHFGVPSVSFPTTVDECKAHGLFYQMISQTYSFTVSYVPSNLSSVGVALSHISTENSVLREF